MRLFIVRHGKATEGPNPLPAHPRPAGYPDDFDRTLSARGEAQARHLAERLRREHVRVDVLLSSRYPRALETARILAGAVGAGVETALGLEVDHSVGEVLRLIEGHASRVGPSGSLMLVGHNPQLGELLGVLAAGLPAEGTILKTGELVMLEPRTGQPVGSARVLGRWRLENGGCEWRGGAEAARV